MAATYDVQDRLSTYNSLTYSYTPNGELQSKTDAATRQTTTYTYDVMGNLTQVVLPTKTVRYVVDGRNRRQARVVGDAVQAQYLYEDQLRIGAVLDAAGTITHRFMYGAKPHVPDYMIRAGVQYKIISDAIGSVRLAVNSVTGAVVQQLNYDAFGKVLKDTRPGFQPFGFAGCLYGPDTTLCRFGARDYDAHMGRWVSKDPIGFAGGDTNLYGYVLNEPINFIDPEGTIGVGALLGPIWSGTIKPGGTGAVIGGAVGGVIGTALGSALGGVGGLGGGLLGGIVGSYVGSLFDGPRLPNDVQEHWQSLKNPVTFPHPTDFDDLLDPYAGKPTIRPAPCR